MKIKTQDLIDRPLNWAVCKARGLFDLDVSAWRYGKSRSG